MAAETQSDPPTAPPSRVAVDEKQIEGDGEIKRLSAAIDTEFKLLLEVDVFSRRGTLMNEKTFISHRRSQSDEWRSLKRDHVSSPRGKNR